MMITVAILINGNPIMARSAHRIADGDKDENKPATYKLDSGKIVKHFPDDGAVTLAKKLLDDIEDE